MHCSYSYAKDLWERCEAYDWNDPSTIKGIEAMGGHHQEAKVHEVVVDEDCRAISSPAYMLGTSITQVHQSVTALIHTLDALLRQQVKI